MNGKKKQFTVEVVSFLFILLFVYAALMKGIDMGKFKAELDQSPLLMAFAGWVKWVVPAIEFIIVAMLIMPRTKLIGLYAAYTMMAMFTTYIIVILNFADHLPCSCGGILEKMDWTTHLIFNIAFTALAVVGILFLTNEGSEKKVSCII